MQTYDHHFLEDPFRNLKINAAMVGISDQRWEHVTEADAADEVGVRSRMRDKRFDVMPIVTAEGTREYFVTVSWNDYSTVVRKPIGPEDLIPYDTDLREVIRRLALDQRHFYFLSGPKPVVGLISIVNLNCRQVKVLLFNLIAELELALTALITQHLSNSALLAEAEHHTGDFAQSRKNYEEAKREGVDAPFIEYLTLPTLINVITSQGLHEGLRYSGTRFKKLGSLRKLRNDVAHPARSLVTNPSSCVKLWAKLQLLEEVLVRFRET
ncbi:MAG: hypothetical protein ACRERE_43265 [Candidatus Entotheonellia bacterium]